MAKKKKKELKNIKKHHRVNNILLGPLERPAIAWLVERLPQWGHPGSSDLFRLDRIHIHRSLLLSDQL